jgi:hypothetical protein
MNATVEVTDDVYLLQTLPETEPMMRVAQGA